jgi:uncharacterized protein
MSDSLVKRALRSRVAWLIIGIATWELVHHGARAVHDLGWSKQQPHLESTSMPQMTPLAVEPSWIKEGNPAFSSAVYATTPDARTLTGIWQVEGPTRFDWHFGMDEWFYVLEGEVTIEQNGATRTVRPGETVFVPAGAHATWTVKDRLRKSFTLNEPGRATRWARKITSG